MIALLQTEILFFVFMEQLWKNIMLSFGGFLLEIEVALLLIRDFLVQNLM